MSLYMTFIFLSLIIEMSIITILVIPFPIIIRKQFITVADYVSSSLEFRVSIKCFGGLILLLFLDALNRSSSINLHPESTGLGNSGNGDGSQDNVGTNVLITPELIATKFYNQRNFYLSGAILFLLLAIPTVLNILKKIVKYETIVQTEILGKKPSELISLEKKLDKKSIDYETLVKQVKSLEKAYNEKADTLNKVEMKEFEKESKKTS
ncbi:uncharacterized protein ASCRUDRAFT_113819 [Ascoidea rubescens DSM 1968]|uniref:Endoplasmic reticulum transmembrane protein n=1 Tax=Ascoidea rubescens DSM 1968 TaxID=1344418 RepID=A0A1D2VC73_9ASCO|nr:hypothetical protein ASCRUDRAFT_113819 [Ascoidea rubescens DSM 1968]ODV59226.1 hypothetical protein ASCRUDRAFT_113819 [Ascoidea rubescens DSM 1968]